ncbi:VacB/RNase II family 3'-5' exoribonuclease [Teredinibacter purpureus]|uniref:VacB/RNase II family 3'-5' exoribonuclease n=1 Tax=Teredinibacter purpureus TaxID=2731756 RepID=UPI0005F782CC|nr:VacB/RNase II family 3'-5' exoribonuclease [Teredinibacter purpureus]
MLDKDILSQLSQLKTDIQSSKEYAEGAVAGSNGRFGFVRLDDGRDAFLSPEKMLHVIPGDRVKVSLTQNAKGQLEATLESLIEQSLRRFLGQYKGSKKGHFVVPLGETPGLKSSPINRWIFLPPKARGRCKDGDLVVARLVQHPYKDGKASAKILDRIGQDDDAYIERQFVSAKYDLAPRFNESAQKQSKSIEQQFAQQEWGEQRVNLTDRPFVTIDSASTRDMDDALALEKIEMDGATQYQLSVAIADPASFIDQNSALAHSCQTSAQSLYLLGGGISMLPEALANDCFSLKENEQRPALVCNQTYNDQGELLEYSFQKALITSQHKLSYKGVTALLNKDEDAELATLPDNIQQMLHSLGELSERRTAYRKREYLVGDDQLEYDIHLSTKGKIDAISPRSRTKAHRIVEEAMLATNLCAGELLQQKNEGLFTTHCGFRADRIGEVKALLKEEEIEHDDLLTEAGYLNVIQKISRSEKSHLVSPLRRMMPSSELSLEYGPHMGMGIPHYATITSPIRRFADLYNHWALNQALTGYALKPLKNEQLDAVKDALIRGRQADRELFQWLMCQYTQSLVGQTGKAKIRIVTQQGFGARLIDSGIDGFILFTKKQPKVFDAKRMTITVNEITYQLEQEVDIKIESVDMDKRRIAFSVITDV